MYSNYNFKYSISGQSSTVLICAICTGNLNRLTFNILIIKNQSIYKANQLGSFFVMKILIVKELKNS